MVAGRHGRLAHLGRRPARPTPVVLHSTAAALTFRLEILSEAKDSRARCGVLRTPHGCVETPFFCSVGTPGSVAGITPAELREVGVMVLLANSYQLLLRPGPDAIRELGGLHRFMAWPGLLISDSGGLPVFSLPLRSDNKAPRLVRVDDDGATFTSYIDGSRQRLTPESSMALQEALGADVALALDEPTSPMHDAGYTLRAMERSHAWARRCIEARQRADQALYGIVQGGAFEELRTASATFIGAQPFDGAAIGGSLGSSPADMHAVVEWTVPRLPPEWPRHLLGIGEPADLFAGVERGIDQFDSASPTRHGRQGQVYTLRGRLSVTGPELAEDPRPLDEDCGCYACRTGFSRGYLRHLFAANELLGSTLASLHNIYFIQRLMRQMRQAIRADSLADLRDEFLNSYTVAAAS